METHDHSTDSRRGSKPKLPRSEMKFTNVSLTLVNSEGLPPTLGSLTIYRDTKKIVHTGYDTGKEISFYLDDLSLPTNKPPMRELCLDNRSRGSSLPGDLVHIEIEGRSTKATAYIHEKLKKLKCEDSIATLKALGKCAKCGQEYGKVVNVVRANADDLVEYRLRPYIGPCGHVFCGECVGIAGDHCESKEREPVQCTLCPGSMKCKWMHCQGLSKLIDKMDDIVTLLEHSKDQNKNLVKNTSCALSECAKCKLKEKTERMHICLGCAKDKGVTEQAREALVTPCNAIVEAVNDPQAQDHICVKYVDKMTPFVFCGNCFVNDHENHTRAKYIDEVRYLVTLAVEKMETFVDSIDKSFFDMLNERPVFVEWQEKTANKKTLKFDEITYEEALDIYNDIGMERRSVTKVVEKTLAEFDKGLKAFEEQVTDRTEKVQVNRKRKAVEIDEERALNMSNN